MSFSQELDIQPGVKNFAVPVFEQINYQFAFQMFFEEPTEEDAPNPKVKFYTRIRGEEEFGEAVDLQLTLAKAEEGAPIDPDANHLVHEFHGIFDEFKIEYSGPLPRLSLISGN